MTDTGQYAAHSDERINLQNVYSPSNLLKLVWHRRRIVFYSTAIAMVAALLVAIITPKSYSVYMTVGPLEGGQPDISSGALGQLGSLAGIQLSSQGSSQVQHFRLLMTGTRVASEMERRYHVLREILPNAWNAQKNRWKDRNEVSLGPVGTIKEFLGLSHWSQPSAVTLSAILSDRIVFAEIPRTPFSQVTYRTTDPDRGIALLTELNKVTSEVYNEGLARDIQNQISYIDELLRKETRENVRAAQMRMLDQYSNRLISLHSGQSLLVQVIQPPTVGIAPTWPRPSLMLLLGAVLGTLAGIAIAIFWPVGMTVWDVMPGWRSRVSDVQKVWQNTIERHQRM